ncbi:MAG: DNA recombination protein RmuC [Gammaproteobacteria bacterium]|nr:DNA recombination protein RmuC [Gammaproteobacteria bacterium]
MTFESGGLIVIVGVALVAAAVGFTIGRLRAGGVLAVVRHKLGIATGRQAELAAELEGNNARIDSLQQQLSEREKALSAATANLESERRRLEEAARRFSELGEELVRQQGKTAAVEQERNTLNADLVALRTTLEAEKRHTAEQIQLLQENRDALKVEFKQLASEIVEKQGKALSEQSRHSLDTLLTPFRQQIQEFKGRVESLQLEGTKQQSEMKTELKQLQSMHQQMTQEAHNLSTALQGQKKVQGNWGELILENVLERSGLQLGRDYDREVSFNKEAGGRSRPDVIVHLPDDKQLIIDAKVSLAAYTRYVNSEDELERQQAISEHVAAFAARIKELADRDYYKLSGLNSPEIVFMFVPIESAFVEALRADETLFQKAIEQNVLVATPTTLLTSLNIVRQLWRFEDQNKHTAELARKADSVFRKLKTFLQSFDGIRGGLDKAQAAYATAERQLVNGPGNLVKQVNEFKQLAPAIKDQLPEYFVEKADLELNHQPLDDDVVPEDESRVGLEEKPE